jgi:transposase
MFSMPKAFPLDFRREVVAVTHRGEAPIAPIAKDFGMLRIVFAALVETGRHRRGREARATQVETAELREAKKLIRLLEQENEILRRAAAYLPQASLPK